MLPSAQAADPQVVSALVPFFGRLVAAIAVALIAWRVAASVRTWFERATVRSPADLHARVLVGRLLYAVVLIYGLLWTIEVLGISPAALVAGFGVLGLAASLALQDILKSVCAGVYLLFERPFLIGDDIKIKDFQGRVLDIGLRTTALRAEDGREVLIPNAVVLSEIIVNRAPRRTQQLGPIRLNEPEP
jgi:small conductance mechanosensitive channel